MKIAVIDASGVIQIVLHKAKQKKFEDALHDAGLVLAPDLYVSELSNTLWKYSTKDIYTPEECIQFIQDGLGFINNYINSKDIWKEAFGEAVKNKHPVYDMLYAVTARRNNALLITNDEDLSKICGKLGIEYCY
jgi:predicted nucleic acid-binding protein